MGKSKNRSRSPKKHRRDRSSEKKRISYEKSREERGKKRKSYERDERSNRSSDRELSSSSFNKADRVQKGIDAAKNRMRASLTSAITTLSDKQSYCTTLENTDHSSTLSVMDSLSRQVRIEAIEEEGFRPLSFTSGNSNNVDTLSKVKSKKGELDPTSNLKEHDKAMFGPMWASREIEKKQLRAKINESSVPAVAPKTLVPNPTVDIPQSSIAHPRLSADPEGRERKWLELFQSQRKALIVEK